MKNNLSTQEQFDQFANDLGTLMEVLSSDITIYQEIILAVFRKLNFLVERGLLNVRDIQDITENAIKRIESFQDSMEIYEEFKNKYIDYEEETPE